MRVVDDPCELHLQDAVELPGDEIDVEIKRPWHPASSSVSRVLSAASHAAVGTPPDRDTTHFRKLLVSHLGRGAGAKSTSFVSGPHAAPTKINRAPTITRTSTVYLKGMKWARPA